MRRKTEDALQEIPKTLSIITRKGCSNALSFTREGKAFLIPLSQHTQKVAVRKNQIAFNGTLATLTDLIDMGDENIDAYDIRLLYVIFSMLLENDISDVMEEINIYVPDLLELMGLQRNLSQPQINNFITEKVIPLKRLVGVLLDDAGQIAVSLPAIVNPEYDKGRNIVSFCAPCLVHLIKILSSGDLISYRNLIKLPLHKCNMAVFESVRIILTTISQAGNKPHISAATIYSRNPFLQKRLEECTPKNRQRILSVTFRSTFEFLKHGTWLSDSKPDIPIPNQIPLVSNMKQTVYRFGDSGKNKSKEEK